MKMKVNDDSPLKSRLDMYLGYRRHRAQFWDDDIWKRHEDRNDGPLEVPEPGFEREFGEVRYSEKLPKMMEIGGYDIG